MKKRANKLSGELDLPRRKSSCSSPRLALDSPSNRTTVDPEQEEVHTSIWAFIWDMLHICAGYAWGFNVSCISAKLSSYALYACASWANILPSIYAFDNFPLGQLVFQPQQFLIMNMYYPVMSRDSRPWAAVWDTALENVLPRNASDAALVFFLLWFFWLQAILAAVTSILRKALAPELVLNSASASAEPPLVTELATEGGEKLFTYFELYLDGCKTWHHSIHIWQRRMSQRLQGISPFLWKISMEQPKAGSVWLALMIDLADSKDNVKNASIYNLINYCNRIIRPRQESCL